MASATNSRAPGVPDLRALPALLAEARELFAIRAAFGAVDSGLWPYRFDGLAKKNLGEAGDDEVFQFTDFRIPHICIEALRLLIEVRHTDEYIRCLAENAPLGVFDERFADTVTTKIARYPEELNVADECSLHADHQESGRLTVHFRQKTFARSVAQQMKTAFMAGAKRSGP